MEEEMEIVSVMLDAINKGNETIKNYKIMHYTQEGLEGKIILSISFDIKENKVFTLTRNIKETNPLYFSRVARFQIIDGGDVTSGGDIKYYNTNGKDFFAEKIFQEVERREPEYLRTW